MFKVEILGGKWIFNLTMYFTKLESITRYSPYLFFFLPPFVMTITDRSLKYYTSVFYNTK